MNQEKIGKFIAECRKEKNLTQLQLAEMLNISNRAVSKWETGKSCPDVSIMMELCDILGINVNELLSGERIMMENYQKKAEQNLVELQKQKEQANKMKRKLEKIWGVITIILCPVHLAINYFYPENQGTYIGWVILIIGALLFVPYFLKYYKVEIKLK
ncbi:helix-turn-helix transcriptional regulator [Lachnospiraceae bacterium 48-42]